MCEPTTATIAMGAISTAVGFGSSMIQSQQQQAYQDAMFESQEQARYNNFVASSDAANQQYLQNNTRIQQESEAASDEIQRIQRERLEEQGSAIASGEGQLSAIIADFSRQEARYKESVRQNFDMTTMQILDEQQNIERTAQARIDSMQPYVPSPVSGPDYLGAVGGLATTGVKGYGMYKWQETGDEKWKGLAL